VQLFIILWQLRPNVHLIFSLFRFLKILSHNLRNYQSFEGFTPGTLIQRVYRIQIRVFLLKLSKLMETVEHVVDFEAISKVTGNNYTAPNTSRSIHRVIFIFSGQVNEKVLHLPHVEVLR